MMRCPPILILAVATALGCLEPRVAAAQSAPAARSAPAAPSAQSLREAPRVLFLTHSALYRHASLQPAEEAVTEWGRDGGFSVVTHQGYEQAGDDMDLSFLTAEYLAGFDGLVMMTNGNLPVTDGQKEAILEFVRRGGGFVGVHNAALTFYDYAPFGEMLGGYFRDPVQQGHPFVLRVEEADHPATRMLGERWTVTDELYLFGAGVWDPARPDENRDELFGNPIPVAFSRDRVTVLLSIDTERTDLDADLEGLEALEPGGDYPQAWYRDYGEGRSFYTALGHTEEIWRENPLFRAHLVGGIRWALGLDD